MTTKIPTQRGISALLAKNGFERSKSTPSRIRGYRNHSAGYSVQGAYDGVVWVRHETISFRPRPAEEPRITEKLGQYAEVIGAAGFAVERGSDRLVVTAKAEES
jgi:hypothetical protein